MPQAYWHRYNGYLAPFLQQIEGLWSEHVPMADIADRLRPVIRAYYKNDNGYLYPCRTEHIKYTLMRIGCIKPYAPKKTPTVPPRKYTIDWSQAFSPRLPQIKGRPIDMGGPRDIWLEADPWSTF